MSRNTTFHTVTGTHLGESAKAIRFRVNQIGTEVLDTPIITWFPFSQVEKITTNKNIEGADTLMVSEWILKQKEMM